MNRGSERSLTNTELENYVKKFKMRNFRRCFMRDQLKNVKPMNKECGILNLNLSAEPGSHWVCWYKNNKEKYYFNSFGLPPPDELIDYLKRPILYSTFQLQGIMDENCGKWCLKILKQLNEGVDYVDIIFGQVKWRKKN